MKASKFSLPRIYINTYIHIYLYVYIYISENFCTVIGTIHFRVSPHANTHTHTSPDFLRIRGRPLQNVRPGRIYLYIHIPIYIFTNIFSVIYSYNVRPGRIYL